MARCICHNVSGFSLFLEMKSFTLSPKRWKFFANKWMNHCWGSLSLFYFPFWVTFLTSSIIFPSCFYTFVFSVGTHTLSFAWQIFLFIFVPFWFSSLNLTNFAHFGEKFVKLFVSQNWGKKYFIPSQADPYIKVFLEPSSLLVVSHILFLIP